MGAHYVIMWFSAFRAPRNQHYSLIGEKNSQTIFFFDKVGAPKNQHIQINDLKTYRKYSWFYLIL